MTEWQHYLKIEMYEYDKITYKTTINLSNKKSIAKALTELKTKAQTSSYKNPNKTSTGRKTKILKIEITSKTNNMIRCKPFINKKTHQVSITLNKKTFKILKTRNPKTVILKDVTFEW